MSPGPQRMRLGKYNDEGFANEGSLMKLGLHGALAGPVAKAMNMGISKATKEQYRTAIMLTKSSKKQLVINFGPG